MSQRLPLCVSPAGKLPRRDDERPCPAAPTPPMTASLLLQNAAGCAGSPMAISAQPARPTTLSRMLRRIHRGRRCPRWAALFARIVANFCLDRLKSAAYRRKQYVGPSLPEPIVAQARMVEPEAGDPALEIPFGIMRALERLWRLERAALFLHDFYDVPFDEVAETLHRSLSPAATGFPAPQAAEGRPPRATGRMPRSASTAICAASPKRPTGSLEPLKDAADGRCRARRRRRLRQGVAARNVSRLRTVSPRLLVGIDRRTLLVGSAFAPVLVRRPRADARRRRPVTQAMGFSLDRYGAINGIYIVRIPISSPASNHRRGLSRRR